MRRIKKAPPRILTRTRIDRRSVTTSKRESLASSTVGAQRGNGTPAKASFSFRREGGDAVFAAGRDGVERTFL